VVTMIGDIWLELRDKRYFLWRGEPQRDDSYMNDEKDKRLSCFKTPER
jgi:hypothetical protein